MTQGLLPGPLEFAEEHFVGGDYRAEVDVRLPEGANVIKCWRNGVLVYDRAMGGWLVDPAGLP